MLHRQLDRSRLLDLMRAYNAFAQRTLALAAESDLLEGGVVGHWSIKDVIAHLTAWETRTLRWLDEAARGVRLTVPEAGFGWGEAAFEQLNDKYYQLYKDRPLTEILADFRRVQGQMIAEVESFSDEELAGGGRFTSMFTDSPADAIYSNTAHHYELHLSQIRDWLRKRGQAIHPKMDKALLLDLIALEYAFYQRTLALVPETRIDEVWYGIWSIKDIVAHLAAWERLLMEWIDKAQRGESFTIPSEVDIDSINAEFYAQDKDRPYDAICQQAQATHQQLIEVLTALPEEFAFTPGRVPPMGKAALWRLIAPNTYEHYEEHTLPIREWLIKG